jgi:hypothetical protein
MLFSSLSKAEKVMEERCEVANISHATCKTLELEVGCSGGIRFESGEELGINEFLKYISLRISLGSGFS